MAKKGEREMKIDLVSLAAFPYHSAESIHLAMFSIAMNNYCDYQLVTACKWWRPSTFTADTLSVYGIDAVNAFSEKKLLQFKRGGSGFIRRSVSRAKERGAMVYARQVSVAMCSTSQNVDTVLELHCLPSEADQENFKLLCFSPRLRLIVVISQALKNDLEEILSVGVNIVVAPDAANEKKFEGYTDFGGSKDLVCGYVGGCFPGKGLEVLKPLSHLLKGMDVELFGDTLGGVENECPLKCNGKIPYSAVPHAFKRFQIALLPNQPSVLMSDGSDIGKYTSPMKMFEYMAAGKAIVASDLPILREVLTNEVNALLVPHDDVSAWADAIRRLNADRVLASKIAKRARRDFIEQFSYASRAKKILQEVSIVRE